MRLCALAVLALAGLLLPRPTAAFDLEKTRAIDLSYSLDAHTLYWPSSPTGFELQTLHRGKTDAGYFYAANAFARPSTVARTSTRRSISLKARRASTRSRWHSSSRRRS